MSIDRRGSVVVVGGGPAGAASAVALRTHGHYGPIMMLCGEPQAPYSRPPLSKAFLRGEVALADLVLDTADAEVRTGVRADRVDLDAKRVRTADGDELPYDGLVLATGLAPRRPSDPTVAVLATAADAASLAPRLSAASSVAVVGSGFLAYELASAAHAAGAATTLVTRPGSLEARFGAPAAVLPRRARAAGVAVRETAGGAFEDGTVRTVEGARIEADLVVAAIGGDASPIAGVPRLDADDRCRIRPDVVVAGDAAVLRTAAGPRRDATWTNALAQGAAAARALLDDDAPAFAPTPYAWTEGFGIDVKIAGTPPGPDAEVILVDGDAAEDRLLLAWPGGAAAVGYRIPVARLRALAERGPATLVR